MYCFLLTRNFRSKNKFASKYFERVTKALELNELDVFELIPSIVWIEINEYKRHVLWRVDFFCY